MLTPEERFTMRKTLYAGLYASAALAGILTARSAEPTADEIPAGGGVPEPEAAPVTLEGAESAILTVAGDIEELTRDVIAGCRDMTNDSRCSEDLKIQLNAWANRFEEKAAALGEAIRVKLSAV